MTYKNSIKVFKLIHFNRIGDSSVMSTTYQFLAFGKDFSSDIEIKQISKFCEKLYKLSINRYHVNEPTERLISFSLRNSVFL